MTDRELLEAAAKAAGFDIDYLAGKAIRRESDGQPVYWNPLADDGDALRLAVKLKLNVLAQYANGGGAGVVTVESHEPFDAKQQLTRGDPYAATRRAITRAAAAMDKG